MTTLTIKHIGPLRDTGKLSITPMTIIMGEQSTGKSTLMKIFCFCQWVEKHAMVGEAKFLNDYTHAGRFREELMKFYHISPDFFSEASLLDYESDAIRITLSGAGSNAVITKKEGFASLAHNYKLCFVPAERNIVTAVSRIERLYRSTELDLLFNHITEWGEAKRSFTKQRMLPLQFLRDMSYYYDRDADKDIIRLGAEGRNIEPYYASSGIQSGLPIVAMATYLRQIIGQAATATPAEASDNRLKDQIKNVLEQLQNDSQSSEAVKALRSQIATKLAQNEAARNTYQHFCLFIEEPELNLFPNAQAILLRMLVEDLCTASKASHRPSTIMLTTHSPYMLTALNVLIKAAVAHQINPEKTEAIISSKGIIPTDWYSAYHITTTGNVLSLIDNEDHFIVGDYLDAISAEVDEETYQLNEIIYGDH